MEKKETLVQLLKGIYRNIDAGRTEKYGKNFVADLVLARPQINQQFKLLKAAGVAYSDEICMKVLENVGVAKYF